MHEQQIGYEIPFGLIYIHSQFVPFTFPFNFERFFLFAGPQHIVLNIWYMNKYIWVEKNSCRLLQQSIEHGL